MIVVCKKRSRLSGRPQASFGSLFTSVLAPAINAGASVLDSSLAKHSANKQASIPEPKVDTESIKNLNVPNPVEKPLQFNQEIVQSDPTKARLGTRVGQRHKCWIGAAIGAATSIAGSLFGNAAQKKQMRAQQRMQDYNNAIQEAQGITQSLNGSTDAQEAYLKQFRTAARFGKSLGNNNIVITDGGDAQPVDNNTFLLRGGSHEDINETGQTGIGINVGGNQIEAEGGEVAQKKNGSLRIFSAQPILGNGMSPAQAILKGYNKDKVFAAQQRFKKNNHLNDDGSKFRGGGYADTTPSPLDILRILYDKTLGRFDDKNPNLITGVAPTPGRGKINNLGQVKSGLRTKNMLPTKRMKVYKPLSNGLYKVINTNKVKYKDFRNAGYKDVKDYDYIRRRIDKDYELMDWYNTRMKGYDEYAPAFTHKDVYGYRFGGKVYNKPNYYHWMHQTSDNLKVNPIDNSYDYRAYYDSATPWELANTMYNADNGHFTDIGKLPSHPTFSNESKYSNSKTHGGNWDGNVFVPSIWQFGNNGNKIRNRYINNTGEGYFNGRRNVFPRSKHGLGGDIKKFWNFIKNGRSPIDNITALVTGYQMINPNSEYNKKKGKFSGGKNFKGAGANITWTDDYKPKGFDNFNDAYDDAVDHNAETFIYGGKRYNTWKENNPIREINNRAVGTWRDSVVTKDRNGYGKDFGPINHPMTMFPIVTETYNPKRKKHDLGGYSRPVKGIRPKAEWGDGVPFNKRYTSIYDAPDYDQTYNGDNALGNQEVTITAKRIKPTYMKPNDDALNLISVPKKEEVPYIPRHTNRSRTIFSGGDYLGLGIDTLAALSTGLINYNTAGNYVLPERAGYITPSKLVTNYNISPQLQEIKRMRDGLRSSAYNNTSSSVAALNRDNTYNINALTELGKLYADKENKETELLNQDALNQQGVAEKNIANDIAYNTEKARILNEYNQLRGNSLSASLSGLSQAWTNFWTAGRTAYEDDQARRASIASSKDASPTKFLEMGYDLSPDLIASLYKASTDDRTKRFYLSRLSPKQRIKYGIN